MYVNINTSGIKRQTSNVDSYIEDTYRSLNEVKTVMSNISLIWKGKDQKEFDSKLNDLISETKKLEESLEKYNEFVKGYLIAEETLDNHYKNKKISLK